MDQIKFEIWGHFVGQKGKKRKIAKKRNRNFWQSYRSQRAEILHSSLSHCYLHYNTNNTDRYIWSGLRHRQKNDPVCRLSCELLFAYWTNNFCEFNFGPLSTLKLQLSFGTLHLLLKRWRRPYSPNIWCRLGGGGGRHSQHHRRCQGGHQEEQSKELHGHKNSMCLWGYEIVFNTSVVVYSLSWRQGVPFLLFFAESDAVSFCHQLGSNYQLSCPTCSIRFVLFFANNNLRGTGFGICLEASAGTAIRSTYLDTCAIPKQTWS